MDDTFGPVPISRIKAESSAIFDALAARRRVLISRQGQVVVVIEPHVRVPPTILAAYASPGEPPLPELNATTINQGSPSALVNNAVDIGQPFFVTRGSAVYGVGRAVTIPELVAEIPTTQQATEIDAKVSAFIDANPDAAADQIAAFTASTEHEVLSRPQGVYVEQSPSDYELWRQAVTSWVAPGGAATLADAVKRAVSLTSRMSSRSVRDGDEAFAAGRLSEAQERYGLAASVGDTVAMLRLGDLATRNGDADTARAWYAEAVETTQSDASESADDAVATFAATSGRDAR